MQVRIEDVSPVEKKLIVEVPWETVNSKLTSAYRDLSKSVQLRGFRKGKVPLSVIQRMYGKRVRAEVTNELVRESFITAATEHDLSPVSEPRVEQEPVIEKGKPLSFEAIFEIKGEVEAKDYSGMELVRRPLNVPDEAVDHDLEKLRREHTELMPVEGRDTTARTDVLTIKLSGFIDEQPIDQPQMMVDLSEPEREPLPGLIAALTGLPINVEDHDIELVMPEDTPELAGKTVKLTISILDARKKEVPELDDEFAKDLDRGETLDELRQSVRADLEKRQEQEIKSELRDAALKELVKRNPIAVASSLVERGVEYQHQRMQHMYSMFGMHDHDAELTEELRERLRPGALEGVRGELLIEAIANQENIVVSDEELHEHIAEMAQSRGMPVARLRAELDRDNQLENVRYEYRHNKILDLLVERATVTEVEPADHDHDHDHDHEQQNTAAEGAGPTESGSDTEAGGEAASHTHGEIESSSAGSGEADDGEPAGESR